MVKTQQEQKQEDESVCTHCQKLYSKKCSIKKYCKIHKGQCFSCRHCIQPSQKAQLKACSICSRLSSEDELLHDTQCDKYYCILQFLNYPLKNSKSLKFPCSHKVSRKKFMDVIKNFCYSCGRKKSEKGQKRSDDLYKCRLCTLKQEEESAQALIEQKQKNKKTQISHQEYYDQKNEFIVNEILKNKIQKQCNICLEEFDQEQHVPYMICIRQHMICDKCLSSVKTCPLCKLKIDKKHCLPYRNILERIKLEKIASEKQEEFEAYRKRSNYESPIKSIQNEQPQKKKKKPLNQMYIAQKRQKQAQLSQLNQQKQQTQQKQRNSWNLNWLFKTVSGFFKKE